MHYRQCKGWSTRAHARVQGFVAKVLACLPPECKKLESFYQQRGFEYSHHIVHIIQAAFIPEQKYHHLPKILG